MRFEIINIICSNDDIKVFPEVSYHKSSLYSFPVTTGADSHRKLSMVFPDYIDYRFNGFDLMLLPVKFGQLFIHYLLYGDTTVEFAGFNDFIRYYPTWAAGMLS